MSAPLKGDKGNDKTDSTVEMGQSLGQDSTVEMNETNARLGHYG